MPKQPIHPEMDAFQRKMEPIYDKLSIRIRRNLERGQTPAEAVNNAVKDVNYAEILGQEIPESAIALYIGFTGPEIGSLGKRTWWLNHLWKGEKLTLSQRIADAAKMADIKESIYISMRDARSWTGTASALAKQDFIKADLAQHVTKLEQSARRAMAGDVTAYNEYRRNLKVSMRQVERLAQKGAPTTRLKKAYQNVINVSRETSVKALDKAIDRAVKAKARYNADRIARAEMAKAYGQGTYQKAVSDPDVIGMRSDLSSRHPRPDICDFHAKANLFGMGPGVYPLKNLPPYPYHPQCILPGNKIGLLGKPIGITKAHYIGPCVEISTARGCKLSVTENHPILTNSGWKFAQFIKDTDYLINTSTPKGVDSWVEPDNQNTNPAIEDIFGSIVKSFDVIPRTMPVAPEDFYGAGRFMDENINIINMDSLLGRRPKTRIDKIIMYLTFCKIHAPSFFLSNSYIDKIANGFFSASAGNIGRFGDLISIINRHSLVSHNDRFLNSSAFDTGFNEAAAQYTPTNPDLACEFFFRFAGKIAFDKIINVRNFNFSGHVYDLQVDPYKIYNCSGVIVKNCTCVMSQVFEGNPKPLNKGKAASYLSKQSEKTQKAMLGVNGQREFKKNPASWEKNLKNYQGHKSIKSLMEV